MELKELTNKLADILKKIINTDMVEYKEVYESHHTCPIGTWSPDDYYKELEYMCKAISRISSRILEINIKEYFYDIKSIEHDILDIEEDYNKLIKEYFKDLEAMKYYEDED